MRDEWRRRFGLLRSVEEVTSCLSKCTKEGGRRMVFGGIK
jgi:hypothetical protein